MPNSIVLHKEGIIEWYDFEDFKKEGVQPFEKDGMVTIFEKSKTPHQASLIFSCLAPIKDLELFVSQHERSFEWHGQMQPAIISSLETEYLRYGNEEGLEPLCFIRDSLDQTGYEIQLSQEFQMLFNIYLLENGELISVNQMGNERTVGVIEDNALRLDPALVNSYAKFKGLNLVQHFVLNRLSSEHAEVRGFDNGGTFHTVGPARFRHCYPLNPFDTCSAKFNSEVLGFRVTSTQNHAEELLEFYSWYLPK